MMMSEDMVDEAEDISKRADVVRLSRHNLFHVVGDINFLVYINSINKQARRSVSCARAQRYRMIHPSRMNLYGR
jgi:hypothetical protein